MAHCAPSAAENRQSKIIIMKTIRLKKGLDLRIKGGVSDLTPQVVSEPRVAICPDDFPGFMPKADVKAGDEVTVGTALMHDKNCPDVRLVSPVNGTVEDVLRGERRHIERVVVKVGADATGMNAIDVRTAQKDEDALRKLLQNAGLWAMMRQRPYDIVPKADATPRDIFVTTFDSAPLAPSLMTGLSAQNIEAGVKALGRLTTGKVYVGVREGGPKEIPGAEVVMFKGPHPCGNAGVQAANIAPVNKGETIWTLDIVTVSRIGHLILTGELDTLTIASVAGPEVERPKLVQTLIGAEIAPLVKGDIKDDDTHRRYIAGNVLTGVNAGREGFLHFPYRQVTVMREGDDADEFMGWASPGIDKMSQSPTFLSRLFGRKKFAPDARIHGGKRAMILSGDYDKVMPMDILPEYLLKAIISRDIDRMEQLGIYEVAPEDFALCEYVDASKIEMQKIVREGLDYLRKELE